MGNHSGKRELSAEKASKDGEIHRGEAGKKRSVGKLSQTASEDSDVFGLTHENYPLWLPAPEVAARPDPR
uniref:Isoform 3 of Myelin basic protein n=1 Tax=Mus musculus TaxID=10090 RepID=P04370-3|nr:alternate [Mus musculus]